MRDHSTTHSRPKPSGAEGRRSEPGGSGRSHRVAVSTTSRPRLTLLLVAVTAIGACASAGTVGTTRSADRRVLPPAMTEIDVQMAEQTLQTALEAEISDNSRGWRNPQSGAAGTITPVRTYRTVSGIFCREFEETITADGNTEIRRDTACRDRQGVWRPL